MSRKIQPLRISLNNFHIHGKSTKCELGDKRGERMGGNLHLLSCSPSLYWLMYRCHGLSVYPV